MRKTETYLHLMGGVDIESWRYGQERHPKAQTPNLFRDDKEFSAVSEYIAKGLPIIGVCRGAQLLCVANGGELWQHAERHGISHDLHTKESIIPNATAGHHQVMRLDKINPDDYEVIAWCPYWTPVYGEENKVEFLEHAPEVVWFPKTKCLAIQPHPEWAGKGDPFRIWIDDLVEKLTGQKDIF